MSTTPQIFRTHLKECTASLHDLVETKYPFCALGEPDGIETTARDAATSFKASFSGFLERMASQDRFYKRMRDTLREAPTLQPQFVAQAPESPAAILANRYLFLGSRMGNTLLVRQNPGLKKTQFGAFFAEPVPSELWSELLSLFKQDLDQELADGIIKESKMIYKILTTAAREVEASRPYQGPLPTA